MRGKSHDPQTRAAALARMIEGATVAEISRDTDIPKATLQRWKLELDADLRLRMDLVEAEKRDRLLERFLTFLDVNLEAATAQARLLCDTEYLRKHDLQSVAVTFGICTDKLNRSVEFIASIEGASAGKDRLEADLVRMKQERDRFERELRDQSHAVETLKRQLTRETVRAIEAPPVPAAAPASSPPEPSPNGKTAEPAKPEPIRLVFT